MDVDMLLSTKQIQGTVKADLSKADLYQMRLMDQQITVGMHGSMDIDSDMKQRHRLSGLMRDVYVTTGRRLTILAISDCC